MIKIIPFSGSCLSGKTTTMNTLKLMLESNGKKVAIAPEPIRSILDELELTIDDLRNDANNFLLVQDKVLFARFYNEIKDVKERYKDYDFLFIDRSAADVFFYISFYFDKKLLLTDGQLNKYKDLLILTKEYVDISAKLYNKVLMFEPLKKIKAVDSYRPKNMSDAKKTLEYEMIKLYTDLFFDKNLVFKVDMNIENETFKIYKMLNEL